MRLCFQDQNQKERIKQLKATIAKQQAELEKLRKNEHSRSVSEDPQLKELSAKLDTLTEMIFKNKDGNDQNVLNEMNAKSNTHSTASVNSDQPKVTAETSKSKTYVSKILQFSRQLDY